VQRGEMVSAPSYSSAKASRGVVLWGNDLRLARSWAFAWGETATAFVSNTACVHKQNQKQKRFAFPFHFYHFSFTAESELLLA